MSFLVSDTDAFFTDFCVEACYNGASMQVLFDSPFKAQNALTGTVETTSPSATCKSSDIYGAQHGETIVINDISYTITGIEPDGMGMTLLILSADG